ncbi:hypothetical protein GCM10010313_01190 [Streptomyces violarus]|nr:hypothetical protein GCM10010313_01190 [Streptomyces violarus]
MAGFGRRPAGYGGQEAGAVVVVMTWPMALPANRRPGTPPKATPGLLRPEEAVRLPPSSRALVKP